MDFLQTLTASVGQAVSEPDVLTRHFTASASERRLLGGAVGSIAPAAPVVQLNAVPTTIDPAVYANARGPSNPGGSLVPLHAFRSLVDPVPALTTYYTPSGITTEQAYGNLLQGATVFGAGSPFVEQVLASAREQFDLAALPSLDGTPANEWRPVYADPPDWYTMDRSRFRPLPQASPGSPGSAFSVPGSAGAAAQLAWTFLDAVKDAVPADARTRVLSTSMRYLQITISRPWLDPTLFRIGGWGLQGQPQGLYSNGELENNGGIMPLLPVSLILGIDAEVTATLGPQDQAMMTVAGALGRLMALGPIPFPAPSAPAPAGAPTTLRSIHPFIVGWVSTLLPVVPPNGS